MPCVTVITVLRNGKNTIENTILSVINQTYSNIEYIIIDGASTDGTLDIIKKYEEKFDYWISEPDKGIYYAMNKGVDLATGEWVIFINSGDSFYSRFVLDEFIKHCSTVNAPVFYGDANFILKNKQKIIKPGLLSKKNHMTFCHQASFVKTNLLKELHFDTTYEICADRDFFWRALIRGYSFQYIPVVVCNYEGENGISAMNRAKTRKEQGRIEGSDKKMWWRFKQVIFVIACAIDKTLPIKILPLLLSKIESH